MKNEYHLHSVEVKVVLERSSTSDSVNLPDFRAYRMRFVARRDSPHTFDVVGLIPGQVSRSSERGRETEADLERVMKNMRFVKEFVLGKLLNPEMLVGEEDDLF
jgi:hypothetical protein